MHLVILVVIVATVYGRDLFDAGYRPPQPHGRYQRQHKNLPPPEIPERRYEENDSNRGYYENERPVNMNNNRQVVNYENSKELINSDENERSHQFLNTNRKHTHGVITNMDINLAFERQGTERQRENNMKLPKQSFSVNNVYSKGVDVNNDDSNRSNSRNLTTQRDDGDMVYRNDDEDDHDKKKTPVKPYNSNSYNNNAPSIGIITFLNNVNINNTNNNINNDHQIKTQPNGSNNTQIGLKSDAVSNTDQQSSKTTIENEVTPNPFRENPNIKEDKWIWSVDRKTDTETATDMTTLAPLDDRAAFEGAQCATGMARIQGMCVPTD